MSRRRLPYKAHPWYYLARMAKTASIDPKTLFEVGVHFGRSKSRRHPTAAPFVFGTKDTNDIFDLEETTKRLESALSEIERIAGLGKQVLFVGGKNEVAATIKSAAERAGVPFVAGRWIGGTLTNFKQVRRRIDRLEKLVSERERGDRTKYTKLERLMLDREIEELEFRFGGLVEMRELPGALFVVDTAYEEIAVNEAAQLGIPVVGLMSSDCDFSPVAFPIPGNDASIKSVRYITQLVADTYLTHKKSVPSALKTSPDEE